jgi:hypothetical protein
LAQDVHGELRGLKSWLSSLGASSARVLRSSEIDRDLLRLTATKRRLTPSSRQEETIFRGVEQKLTRL